MTEATNPTVADKALANQGVAPGDLDPNTDGVGSPEPKAPSNEPPKADPKPEDKPADPVADPPADPDAKELDTDVWGSTGDDVGDSVLALLQNSGLDPDGAKALLYDALQAGDVAKIDRDALIEKVGKAKATLIIAGTENFIQRRTEHTNAVLTTVHEAAGGEGEWVVVRDWANANVPAADLDALRELVEAGGKKAKFAVQELVSLYNADEKNSTLGTTEITPDSRASTQARATSRAEYITELEAAHKRGATEAQLAEISAARQRGRQRGI